MKLDFTEALQKPNKEFDFTFEWEKDDGLFDSIPHKPISSGEILIKYFSDEESIIHVNFEARIPFEFICDKCGINFKQNLYLQANEKILPYEDDDYFSYDSNDQIDIFEFSKQVILSSFPQRVLCKPSCKGLCPTCGINLNHDTCDCNNKKIGKNNPFGQLLGKI